MQNLDGSINLAERGGLPIMPSRLPDMPSGPGMLGEVRLYNSDPSSTTTVTIADLDLSLVQRVRARVSADAIQDYAERPDELPPARVAEIGGRLWLVGGLHRLRAWERAGRTKLPCV